MGARKISIDKGKLALQQMPTNKYRKDELEKSLLLTFYGNHKQVVLKGGTVVGQSHHFRIHPKSRLCSKSRAIGFTEWQSIKQGVQVCRPVTGGGNFRRL